MQSISTQGKVEGELLVIKDGWEVVVSVNATDLWNFYWIIEIILSGLSTDYFNVKILRWVAVFLYFFVADFRFRSSTVESRVCLLSRLVSVLHYHESSISCFTSPFVCTVYYY